MGPFGPCVQVRKPCRLTGGCRGKAPPCRVATDAQSGRAGTQNERLEVKLSAGVNRRAGSAFLRELRPFEVDGLARSRQLWPQFAKSPPKLWVANTQTLGCRYADFLSMGNLFCVLATAVCLMATFLRLDSRKTLALNIVPSPNSLSPSFLPLQRFGEARGTLWRRFHGFGRLDGGSAS